MRAAGVIFTGAALFLAGVLSGQLGSGPRERTAHAIELTAARTTVAVVGRPHVRPAARRAKRARAASHSQVSPQPVATPPPPPPALAQPARALPATTTTRRKAPRATARPRPAAQPAPPPSTTVAATTPAVTTAVEQTVPYGDIAAYTTTGDTSGHGGSGRDGGGHEGPGGGETTTSGHG